MLLWQEEMLISPWRPYEAAEMTRTLLKDVRAQKFPRTDFFKTLAAGRK